MIAAALQPSPGRRHRHIEGWGWRMRCARCPPGLRAPERDPHPLRAELEVPRVEPDQLRRRGPSEAEQEDRAIPGADQPLRERLQHRPKLARRERRLLAGCHPEPATDALPGGDHQAMGPGRVETRRLVGPPRWQSLSSMVGDPALGVGPGNEVGGDGLRLGGKRAQPLVAGRRDP